MLLIAVLVVLALILSSRPIRTAMPFESFLAVGGAALVTMALFQLGRLV